VSHSLDLAREVSPWPLGASMRECVGMTTIW
jgi:hypothetical protein